MNGIKKILPMIGLFLSVNVLGDEVIDRFPDSLTEQEGRKVLNGICNEPRLGGSLKPDFMRETVEHAEQLMGKFGNDARGKKIYEEWQSIWNELIQIDLLHNLCSPSRTI